MTIGWSDGKEGWSDALQRQNEVEDRTTTREKRLAWAASFRT